MMDTNRHTTEAWRDLLWVALAISLIGSAWALLGAAGCVSCRQAADILPRANLPVLGIVFYGLLLLAAVRTPRHPAVAAQAMLAAGAHLTLLSVLITNHLVCPPCYVTAAGAFAATVAVIGMQPRRILAALVAVSIGALGMYGLVMLTVYAARSADQAAAIRAYEDASHPARSLAPGHALLVAYTRENCHYCEEYHTEVLSTLRREFGNTLSVEERPALKGLPTPTLVILGVHDTAFPGLPTTEDLRHAILQAQGREQPSNPPVGFPVG